MRRELVAVGLAVLSLGAMSLNAATSAASDDVGPPVTLTGEATSPPTADAGMPAGSTAIDHADPRAEEVGRFVEEVQLPAGDWNQIAADLAGAEFFGGAYLSIEKWEHVLQVKESAPADLIEAFRSRIEGPNRRIELVEYSQVELDAGIAALGELLAGEEPALASAFIDTQANRVEAHGVDSADQARSAVAATALDTPSNELYVYGYSGGLEANVDEDLAYGGHAVGDGSADCSLGAHAYRYGFGTQWPFVVTAGHCGDTRRHRQYGFGYPSPTHNPSMSTVAQVTSGSADAQLMGWDQTPYQYDNRVEGWGSSPDFYLTSEAFLHGSYDMPGAWVCHAGFQTGGHANCAPILDTSVSCGSYQGLRSVDYAAIPGDSGATVYGFAYGSYNVPLAGFHKGNCGALEVYSFATNVRLILGIDGWFLT
jgi:hypothetical protein